MFRILTCNVRTSYANDAENDWEYRRRACSDVIASSEPDLIGFQEMTVEQFDDLKQSFGGFASLATLDEPASGGPVNTIFYRKNRFALQSSGAYWLSESPHVPGTQSWDSRCIRLAVWGQLLDLESGRSVRFINTHLDHVGQTARVEQARLINEDAGAYPKVFPQLLTGDMNADRSNAAIESFFQAGWTDTYESVHGAEEPGFTFHSFLGPEFSSDGVGKIDWIFARGRIRAIEAEIIRDAPGGRYPSDHYFVSAALEYLDR